jgi:hypothetical protein
VFGVLYSSEARGGGDAMLQLEVEGSFIRRCGWCGSRIADATERLLRRNTDCILPAWGGCTADTVLSDGMGGMLLAEEVQNSTNKKSALLIVSITASVFFFLPCTPCP